MKKITILNNTYSLIQYPAEVEISEKDFLKLKNKEITINDLIDENKYEIFFEKDKRIIDDKYYLDEDNPFEILENIKEV